MNKSELLTILNEASRDVLMLLPGIGPATADKIIAGRHFSVLEDAYTVNGINDNFISRLLVEESLLTNILDEDISAGGERMTGVPNQTSEEVDNIEGLLEGPEEVILLGPGVLPLEQRLEAPVEEDLLPLEKSVDKIAKEQRSEQVSSAMDNEPEPELEQISMIKGMISNADVSKAGKFSSAPTSTNSTAQKSQKSAEIKSVEMNKPIKNGEHQIKYRLPFWSLLLTGALTALVTILLTLGILNAINRSLTFATAAQLTAAKSEVNQISNRVDSIKQDLENVRGRVDILSGLNDRTASLEKSQQKLSTDLNLVDQELADVQDSLTNMNDQIIAQEERTSKFDTFLQDLQALLSNLYQAKGATK